MKIRLNVINLSLMASMVIFSPSLLMILAHQSSFTIGIVISSLVIIFVRVLIKRQRIVFSNKDLMLILLLVSFFFFIVLHFALVNFIFGGELTHPDFPKFLLSFIFIIISASAASVVKNTINDTSEIDIHSTVLFILYVIIFNAMISFTKIDFFNTML